MNLIRFVSFVVNVTAKSDKYELLYFVVNVQYTVLLTGSIHHLTEEQTNTLRRLFKTNVAFRRDLKKHECLQAIKKNRCLNELDWKKVKNTVHSWIILEKKKTIKLATAKC